MNQANQDISQLIRHVSIMVNRHGLSKVLASVNAHMNGDQADSEMMNAIISTICRHYKLTPRLLHAKDKNPRRVQARKMCYLAINRYLKLSKHKIAKYFEIGRTSVCHTFEEFENMKEHIKSDRDFMTDYTRLCEALDKQHQQINNKYNLI